tara:strand:- start:24 stop:215 length:192 start_codon:yes stop_codon:yes gene_type:complete
MKSGLNGESSFGVRIFLSVGMAGLRRILPGEFAIIQLTVRRSPGAWCRGWLGVKYQVIEFKRF